LPCPFCGAESEVEEVGLGATNGVSFTVGCASKHEDSCMGYQCFQTFALRKDAIAAWNKRAPQPSPPAQGSLDPATVEACAKFVEQHQERITETERGSERSVSPRMVGNQMGLAYAIGIRALELSSTHCACGMTAAGRCPVCLSVASPQSES
jgi:hypothetical protein